MKTIFKYSAIAVVFLMVFNSQSCADYVGIARFNEAHNQIKLRFDSVDYKIDSLTKLVMSLKNNQDTIKANQVELKLNQLKFNANQDTIKTGLRVIHQDMNKTNDNSNYFNNLVKFLQ